MAIPPIIPPPKSNAGKAAQRASEQQKAAAGAYRGPAPVPALPPILHATAPPPSSYRSQAAAYAYRPPAHAKYSSAGLPPAPTAAAPGPAPQSAASQAAQKKVATGQIIAAWFALRSKGLFPATAVPPAIKFDTRDTPGVGAYVVRAGPGLNEFHVPPSFRKMLTSSTDRYLGDWARSAVLHELAHTAQNESTFQSEARAEGGATAFAQNQAPRIYGTPSPPSSGRYGRWLAQVGGRESQDWVSRNQFTPNAPAPPVNMPGSPAFRAAMHGVGANAGTAAQYLAARTGEIGSPDLPLGEGAHRLAGHLASIRLPFGVPRSTRTRRRHGG